MAIPKVFHQLWKTADTPARYAALRETWLRRNPDWTMRLWTDADLAAMVDERYPDLAALYHGYKRNISRADLGRYLVLETFGGVYADLDCECFKPLGPLLDGRTFVVGVEPDSHVDAPFVRRRGFDKIICPSFIASTAGHPFWRDVRAAIVAAVGEEDVLDQTGPFLLTRAYDASPAADQVTVAPAAQTYPFGREHSWGGRAFELETWERLTREAFVAHHWDGSWFRQPTPLDGLPWMISVGFTPVGNPPPPLPDEPAETLISCITLAAPDAGGVALAIEGFRRQTHVNKELLVVCAEADGQAARMVKETGRADVRVLVAGAPSLASAAGHARGPVVCRWDPGCLHDPRRLQIQFEVLRRSRALACRLDRSVVWRPGERRLALCADTGASTMWVKGTLSMAQLADGASREMLADTGRISTFDMPQLTVAVIEPDDPTFEDQWAAASARYDGERCEALAGELAKRLPVSMALSPRAAPVERARPTARSAPGEVVVLTPVKDARRHLPRFFELLGRLDTGGAPLSIGLIEGDSRDGTFEALEAQLAAARERFARTVLIQHHDGLELRGRRQAPDVQRARRAAIARARNRILDAALGDAEWALWLDADVMDYPPDLLLRMLAAGKDIVAAHCVVPSGRTFDENTFIWVDPAARDDRAHMLDGLFQPPRGVGRRYLQDFHDRALVRVDSVGGTALLVSGRLHREGLNFPAYSYGGYIETEGLAMMARDMGHDCWGLPQLRIVHPDPADELVAAAG